MTPCGIVFNEAAFSLVLHYGKQQKHHCTYGIDLYKRLKKSKEDLFFFTRPKQEKTFYEIYKSFVIP